MGSELFCRRFCISAFKSHCINREENSNDATARSSGLQSICYASKVAVMIIIIITGQFSTTSPTKTPTGFHNFGFKSLSFTQNVLDTDTVGWVKGHHHYVLLLTESMVHGHLYLRHLDALMRKCGSKQQENISEKQINKKKHKHSLKTF